MKKWEAIREKCEFYDYCSSCPEKDIGCKHPNDWTQELIDSLNEEVGDKNEHGN